MGRGRRADRGPPTAGDPLLGMREAGGISAQDDLILGGFAEAAPEISGRRRLASALSASPDDGAV